MFTLSPIQIILLVIVLFAISRVYLKTRSGGLSSPAFFFWMSIFFLAGVAIIDPSYTTRIANKLGAGRGVDIAIYISIALLFYLIFRTNVLLEDLRHELTKLVQEIAIKEHEKKENKKKK